MGKVVDLFEKRRHLTARKGFQNWARRFSEPFDEETCPRDLSDGTLGFLIRGGDESSMALYELIMGILGLGAGTRFHYLENTEKMLIMDIALFLLDQLRFEAMRRLGWLEDYPTLHAPMLDLVQEFSDHFSAEKHQTPGLSPNHPRYKEYEETFEGDQAAFIRRLIPEALQNFALPNGH